jgi:hypothetical protein
MARLFNGTSDYLTGTLDLSSTAIVTVTCRLYWDAYATDGDRAMEYTNNPDAGFNGFMIAPNESGSLFGCGISGPGGSTYWTDTFTRPSAAAWHLYTFVFNRTTPVNKAWVDGVSQTLTTQTHNGAAGGNNFDGTSTEINVMRRGTGILFGAGRMAEIAIWNHELSAGDLTALHSGARPSTVDRANLLFYCPVTGAASPEPSVVGNSLTVNGAVFTAHPIDFVEPGRSYKRFVGPAALSATPETLYTVPYNGRSVIRNIYANNPSGADAALTLGIALPDAYADEVLSDSPVAYYRMDEASGQPQDSSGNGNHTTVTFGSETYSQSGAITSDPTSTGIQFNTVTSNFEAPDHASLDVGSVFTVEGWLKLNSLATGLWNAMLIKHAPSFFFATDPTNKLTLYEYSGGECCTSTVATTDTDFHHYVATVNGATVKLYLDGVDVTGTVTPKSWGNSIHPLALGADLGGGQYGPAGVLDELAVYPTALSAARVLAHYEAAQAPDGIFDADTVPAGDILFARRDTNYVLEAGEVLQGFSDTAATVVLVVDGVEYGL